MTKRRSVKKSNAPKANAPERDDILVDDKPAIIDYDKVRYEQRGLDTFTIKLKDGSDLVVKGHDIAMDKKGTDEAKLPIYQIFEYVLSEVNVQHQKTFNDGPVWDADTLETRIEIAFESQYIQVVKAVLWPGEWICVTREFGQ